MKKRMVKMFFAFLIVFMFSNVSFALDTQKEATTVAKKPAAVIQELHTNLKTKKQTAITSQSNATGKTQTVAPLKVSFKSVAKSAAKPAPKKAVKPAAKAVVKPAAKPAPKPKIDASSFIVIKNKSPEQMFDDANYLYQLGEYESALVLFNKVATQTKDPVLKRKANTSREVIDILMKAERIGEKKAPKEYKRAEKVKDRLNHGQIAYLYKEARGKFLKRDYDTATALFRAILQLDPGQKEAREYLDVKIPQILLNDKTDKIYKDGLQCFDIEDYEQAAKLFKQVLVLDPGQKKAKEYLETKIPPKLKEQKIAKLYQDGAGAFENKDYEKAGRIFNEILTLEPKEKEAKQFVEVKIPIALRDIKAKELFEQGVRYFEGQNYPGASDLFRQVLILYPLHAQAKEYLDVKIPQKTKEQKITAFYKEALAALANKEYDKAKLACYDILSIDLKQKEARECLDVKIPAAIQADKIQGMYEEAIAAFEAKDYEAATLMFKNILFLDAKQDQAKEYVEVKIPQVIRDIKVQEISKEAIEYFAIGDYTKAGQLFKEIIALDANQATAKEYLDVKIPQKLTEYKINQLYRDGLGYFTTGDLEKAAQSFKEIIALSANEPDAKEFLNVKIPAAAKEKRIKTYSEKGLITFNNAEYDKASIFFKEVLVLDANNQQAREYMEKLIPAAVGQKEAAVIFGDGLAYFATQNYQKAAELFGQVLELDPGHSRAKDYLENKIPQKVLEQKIATLSPQAIAAFNMKDYDTAKSIFEEVLSLDPQNAQAKAYLGKEIPARLSQVSDEMVRVKKKEAEFSGRKKDEAELRAQREAERMEKEREKENQLAARKGQLTERQAQAEAGRLAKEKNRQAQLAAKREKERARQEAALRRQAKQVSIAPQKPVALPVEATPDSFALSQREQEGMTSAYPQQPQAKKKPVTSKKLIQKDFDYPKDGVVGFLYGRAFQFYEEGDLQSAADCFYKILVMSPNETTARKYLTVITQR